ncbi:hypothetical protein CK203_106934 [Vitis vinifera]|uniref:Reverse transcriptase zinc-binding domain-containing protein n=1 Tax=Vitis vinifera TaxID=29760 RepID=A0A438CDX7_VITVI|nr:hypothetical protein CK203_106934 [Vitis vinifera]
MKVFSCLLRRAISGGYLSGWRVLRINLEKSELIPVGRVYNVEDLALEVGCKVGGLLSRYLGLPLGAPSNQWQCGMVLKRDFEKGQVRLRLEKIQRNFSGVVELLCRNCILLGGTRGIGGLPMKERSFGSKSSVKSMVKRMRGGAPIKLTYQGGNGQRVRLWMDKWCGDEPLCESFPSLFTISSSKEAWVADVWNLDGDGDGWTPLFSRAFNDWELELVEHFLQKIQAFKVHRDAEDRVIWIISRYGTFSVKSLYSILEPEVSPLFPSGSIWRSSVPPKIAFFAWEASWGKVLTLNQLQRRSTSW